MYQGEELPESQVARVLIAGGAEVSKLDAAQGALVNTSFNKGEINKAGRDPGVLEVLPGPHRVQVSLEGGILTPHPVTTLSFDAKAGHSYIIGAIIYMSKKTSKKKWTAKI